MCNTREYNWPRNDNYCRCKCAELKRRLRLAVTSRLPGLLLNYLKVCIFARVASFGKNDWKLVLRLTQMKRNLNQSLSFISLWIFFLIKYKFYTIFLLPISIFRYVTMMNLVCISSRLSITANNQCFCIFQHLWLGVYICHMMLFIHCIPKPLFRTPRAWLCTICMQIALPSE